MATLPATVAVGDLVTAVFANNQRDWWHGDVQSYTPALTAVTTNPTLGSGSVQSGWYIQIGKLVVGQARIVFGTSGVVAGSGNYRISLPVAMALTDRALALTSARLVDASTGNVCSPTILMPPSTTTVEMHMPATWTSGAVSIIAHNVPWTWAASDELTVGFAYRAA